jgi:hypothetical protein
MPQWHRYPADPSDDYPYILGHWWDPYNQNELKGDYPVFGDRWFTNLTASSSTLFDARQLLARQFEFTENLLLSVDVFRGLTAFKPADVRFHITPVINANYLSTRDTASHAALQEAFAEVRLAETSPNFDFVSARAGTQFFKSDFRGFVFSDNEPGIRLFGNLKSNKHQYNLAAFYMVEKDPNSFLNTFRSRNQEVLIGNYYIQDFLKPGYTTEFSVHFSHDGPSMHNPSTLAGERTKDIHAVYLGWSGDGHLGWLNINHAFYQVLGRERLNGKSGVSASEESSIDAQMAAIELSVDRDWKRYRISGFYASGDGNVSDARSRGFDSIFDNVQFAGGPISLWNRQNVPLQGSALGLTQRSSLNASLRTSKIEGQANYVNPGLYLLNSGMDADLTPKIRLSGNVNLLGFARTEPLEAILSRSSIHHAIGIEAGTGARWRPYLTNNVAINAGFSVLRGGAGFRDLSSSKFLLSSFIELQFTY